MMADLTRALDAYRAMEPVADVLEALEAAAGAFEWLSLDFQARVMREIVGDAVCDRHPPQLTYTLRFLKKYMEAIEAEGVDAADELVEALMELVLTAKNRDEIDTDAMHHVSFRVPVASEKTAAVVTCRVASVFNEVGLKIWEAGLFLAEYVIAHRELFDDKSVLELGAGVGITGLVLAASCSPRHLLLTDYAPNVMQNLRYNVEVNADAFKCPVSVETLDWDTWKPSDEGSVLRPDILLAGDCAYDVDAFPSLMRVLQSFLGAPTAGVQRSAIFAATIRNQSTFQAFLDQLAMHKISYTDITAQASEKMGAQRYRYDNRDQIRLCRLVRSVSSVDLETN